MLVVPRSDINAANISWWIASWTPAPPNLSEVLDEEEIGSCELKLDRSRERLNVCPLLSEDARRCVSNTEEAVTGVLMT